MPADPLVARLVDRVRTAIPATVERSVARTFREVPAYPGSADDNLASDLTAHTQTVFDAVLTSLAEGRRATRDDFPITASQARRRLRQGVALPDFLTGFRIGQETLWEAIVEAAEPQAEMRDAALHIAIQVMNVIEVGSSVGAEAYLAAQQLELAEWDRLRRDLMEDLLAGKQLAPGPSAELAEVTDLRPDSRVMVVAAVPASALRTDQSLREALSSVRSMLGTGSRGIAVTRQDHIVGVAPVLTDGHDLVAGLERAQRTLARHGIHLGVGVSTVHDGLAGIPAAHLEAESARVSLAGAAGVRALSQLSPLDYLVMLDDATARRLIREQVRTFVEDDLASGGTLVETLRAYADSNLNAKVAAEGLHVHVNTAYYRLERIAERTGYDLRSFGDLQELLVAVRLLTAGRPA